MKLMLIFWSQNCYPSFPCLGRPHIEFCTFFLQTCTISRIVHIALHCCEEFNAESNILPMCSVVRCAGTCFADVLVLPLVYFVDYTTTGVSVLPIALTSLERSYACNVWSRYCSKINDTVLIGCPELLCVCDISPLYACSWFSIVAAPGQHIHSGESRRLPFCSNELVYKLSSVTHKMLRLLRVTRAKAHVPRTRLRTIGDRSFCVTAAHAWNSLPSSVTTATSLASFKRQLKTFLFTKSFPEL